MSNELLALFAPETFNEFPGVKIVEADDRHFALQTPNDYVILVYKGFEFLPNRESRLFTYSTWTLYDWNQRGNFWHNAYMVQGGLIVTVDQLKDEIRRTLAL